MDTINGFYANLYLYDLQAFAPLPPYAYPLMLIG